MYEHITMALINNRGFKGFGFFSLHLFYIIIIVALASSALSFIYECRWVIGCTAFYKLKFFSLICDRSVSAFVFNFRWNAVHLMPFIFYYLIMEFFWGDSAWLQLQILLIKWSTKIFFVRYKFKIWLFKALLELFPPKILWFVPFVFLVRNLKFLCEKLLKEILNPN